MKKFKKAISFILALVIALAPVGITAQAVSVDTMKSKVLSVAENEVGYEGTSTYSKYGEWYGYQGSWCTTFVLWCFNKAGNSLGVKMYGKIVPNGGNCNSMISWYNNRGRYHKKSSGYSPQKGDLVFFDWSGRGSAQHVGIVTGVSGSTVYTVEGNCSGKVKDRKYTASGKKPYNNISAILGYATPDWGSVSSGSSATTRHTTKRQTTKKHTTKRQTTKKQTTKKAQSTKKQQSAQNTTKKSTAAQTSNKTTKTSQSTQTTAQTATAAPQGKQATDMLLYAAATDLQIGDSVKLDYTLKPSGVNAVVEYFCDEEDIIDLSADGTVKGVGEGTATVVVCANDEIYRQCDFNVTQVSRDVTQKSKDDMSIVETNYAHSPKTTQDDKSIQSRLRELGVNFNQLNAHKDDYIYPLAIIGVTAVISLCIVGVKKIAKKRKRKSGDENGEKDE